MRRIVALFVLVAVAVERSTSFQSVSNPHRIARSSGGFTVHVRPRYGSLGSTATDVSTENNHTLSFPSSGAQRGVTEGDLQDSDQLQKQQMLDDTVTPDAKTIPVAVWLNMNARGVTQATVDVARHVFGTDAVFVTTTAAQADAAADAIRRHSPRILVPVGGDGTLTAVLQSMCRRVVVVSHVDSPVVVAHVDSIDESIRKLPIVAYIPLGTGNAVGSVVGCRVRSSGWWRGRGQTKQLERVMQQIKDMAYDAVESGHVNSLHVVPLPILQVTTQCGSLEPQTSALCFFAGVGFDSLMLNDFKQIKAWSVRTGILTNILSSVTGYCVALVVKTLPQTITKSSHKVRVRVTTRRPDETVWVDHRRGDFVQRVSSPTVTDKNVSTTLFEGEAGILAAGTAPYYGGGLRLFPFARLTLDKMHLRLARVHPATGFFHIPAIFAGSYRDKSDRFGVLDFIGSEFDVQIVAKDDGISSDSEAGFPFQHSGESIGNVESFRLRVVDEPVRFLSLLKER